MLPEVIRSIEAVRAGGGEMFVIANAQVDTSQSRDTPLHAFPTRDSRYDPEPLGAKILVQRERGSE